MNYGQLKANIQALLNRNDVTASLIDAFTQQAIQRAQRLLNVPAMQQVGVLTVDDTYTALPVPGDYLKMVSLKCNDIELTQYPLSTVLNIITNTGSGTPAVWAKDGYYIKIAPFPQEGDEIEITYNADFSGLAADDATNWITQVIPDIITYGALVEGCNFFTDPRGTIFDAQFVQRIDDANMQAKADELLNAAAVAAYSMDFPEDY